MFLDAAEHRWIEELGGMNVFFVFDDGSMATPPLSGTILAGITRDLIITLARREAALSGQEATDRPVARRRGERQAGRGSSPAGTAAVVSPIGKVCSGSGDFLISGGAAGPVAMDPASSWSTSSTAAPRGRGCRSEAEAGEGFLSAGAGFRG